MECIYQKHPMFIRNKERISDMSKICGSYHIHLIKTPDETTNVQSHIIVPVHCKSWDCPTCRPIKARWLRDQMSEYFKDDSIYLLTLTYFQSSSKESVWKNLGKTWNRLITYIHKNHKKLKFIRIVEPHKSGYPHLHVIVDQYIDVSTDLKLLTNQGFGWNMSLTKISIDAAKCYVTKYLTKMEYTEEANKLRKLSKARICSSSKGIHLSPTSSKLWHIVSEKINTSEIKTYIKMYFTSSKAIFNPLIFFEYTNGIIRIDTITATMAEYYSVPVFDINEGLLNIP